MAKKGNRVQVILECTEQKESGLPGMSRYITTKNKKNTPDRMERKKYNPILKRVVQGECITGFCYPMNLLAVPFDTILLYR